jgi:DNA-directed RNA polymerase subunit RPC12/RpoP
MCAPCKGEKWVRFLLGAPGFMKTDICYKCLAVSKRDELVLDKKGRSFACPKCGKSVFLDWPYVYKIIAPVAQTDRAGFS